MISKEQAASCSIAKTKFKICFSSDLYRKTTLVHKMISMTTLVSFWLFCFDEVSLKSTPCRLHICTAGKISLSDFFFCHIGKHNDDMNTNSFLHQILIMVQHLLKRDNNFEIKATKRTYIHRCAFSHLHFYRMYTSTRSLLAFFFINECVFCSW